MTPYAIFSSKRNTDFGTLVKWDDDTQNALAMVASPTDGKDDDLDIECVPRQQPKDISVQIYHSQKMGHWDKKLVNLRTDGQVVAAKKEGVSNLCHLSDFDIYVPTKRQLSKKVRPPKKVCIAIKSQQKSSMFLSTENFVHFFCSNDNGLVVQWYRAVQQWRSWYLVHVLGKGFGGNISPQRSPSNCNQRRSSGPNPKKGGMVNGICTNTIQPVQDFHEESAGGISFKQSRAKQSNSDRLLLDTCSPPDFTSLKKLSQSPNRPVIPAHDRISVPKSVPPPLLADHELFAVTGLLGRTYTQRKRAQQERDEQGMASQGLRNNMLLAKAKGMVGMTSTLPQQNPLVDLTPLYQEPPQHRKGRGLIPDKIPTGGLVEVATSTDRRVSDLPATASRRPKDSEDTFRRSNSVRARQNVHLFGSGAARQKHLSSEFVPFDSGHLAAMSQGRSANGQGRGVKTGDRDAKTSMIDMKEVGQYAPGSLLASVEKHQSKNTSVVIERDKMKKEIDVPVGECSQLDCSLEKGDLAPLTRL